MVCCGSHVGPNGHGAAPYFLRISKYETTNAQYAEFLNAVAAAATHALYNASVGDPSFPNWGGITRSGEAGQFSYGAIAGRENMPVNHVGFYDTARYANWLHDVTTHRSSRQYDDRGRRVHDHRRGHREQYDRAKIRSHPPHGVSSLLDRIPSYRT